jgi:hypothetical protein
MPQRLIRFSLALCKQIIHLVTCTRKGEKLQLSSHRTPKYDAFDDAVFRAGRREKSKKMQAQMKFPSWSIQAHAMPGQQEAPEITKSKHEPFFLRSAG